MDYVCVAYFLKSIKGIALILGKVKSISKSFGIGTAFLAVEEWEAR